MTQTITYSHHSPEVKARIIELALLGYPPRLIAQYVPPLTRIQVAAVTHDARKKGLLPPVETYRNGVWPATFKRGQIEYLLADLTQPQTAWLFSECKRLEVDTIQEFLTELVRDAFEEHLEKHKLESAP